MAIRSTFKVNERLKREQQIRTLFLLGKAFSVFPLRLVYHFVPRDADGTAIKTGFSVPKKQFKLSVDRHRVRRLMVESWRLQKSEVVPAVPAHLSLHLFIIYTGKTLPTQAAIATSTHTALLKLIEINQNIPKV